MRILVSNMYPSLKDPNYGVFVRNFELSLAGSIGAFDQLAVIRGKPAGIFGKLCAYSQLWAKTVWLGLRHPRAFFYVHYFTHCAPPFMLFRFLRLGIRYVINFHGDDLIFRTELQRVLFRLQASIVLPGSDCIVFPSEFFRAKAKELAFLAGVRTAISPSGGLSPTFFLAQRKKSEQSKKVRFITASRIEPGKGHWLVSKVAAALERRGIPFEWTIVGDGSLRMEMEEAVRHEGLEGKVQFTGMLDQRALAARYAESDYFVFPTELKESLGLVALEAMAVGLPVIGSRIGAIPEYVSEGRNGYLFSPGDDQALAALLSTLAEPDSEEYDSLATEARLLAKTFSREMVGETMAELLRSIG